MLVGSAVGPSDGLCVGRDVGAGVVGSGVGAEVEEAVMAMVATLVRFKVELSALAAVASAASKVVVGMFVMVEVTVATRDSKTSIQ